MSFENDSIDMIYANSNKNNQNHNHNSQQQQRRQSSFKPVTPSTIPGQTTAVNNNSRFQPLQRQCSKTTDARCYSMDQSIRSMEQQQQQQLANENDAEDGNQQSQNQNEWNVWNVFNRMRQLKKKKKRKNSWDSIKDSEFEDLDAPNVHFRPEALETLCQLTKFSRKELKMIYRGFKQDAPSGVVREDSFKHIFSQFFPKGADVNQYAHYVFNTFDPERTGIVTFTDFVIGLSVLSRGTTEDKLKWIFSLYDVNCDGIISKDDLSRVIIAVYDLLGKCVQPQVDEATYKQHIDRVFKKLDLNQDGMVTYDIFMEACAKDENILQSFDVFNTLL